MYTKVVFMFFTLFLLVITPAYAQLDRTSTGDRVTLIASSDESVTLGFSLNDIEASTVVTGEETEFYQSIPGEGMTYDNGKPILPIVSRFVVVPPNAGIELVVRHGEVRNVLADHPPKVCRDEMMSSIGGMAGTDYVRDEIYPPQVATMSEPFVIRGVRIVKISTYPVRYDSANNSYHYYDDIETDLNFTDDAPINPVQYPERRNRSAQFLKYIRDFAINGDIVGRDDLDSEPDYVGHYLIVTHESCLEYAAPFIEWRRKSGYKVDILSLSSGNAVNANGIKSAIQSRYDDYLEDGVDPFEYVLLIGDRSAYSYSRPSPGWVLQALPGTSVWGGAPHADYLYGCLEGGNNDHHPDVAVSRWPNGSAALMELAVGRTMMYEATPDMDDPSWFGRTGNYSQHWGNGAETAWHPTIHTNARWGEEVLQSLGFDQVYFYEEFDYDRMGDRIGPEVEDWYNEGINVMVGRAENYYFRDAIRNVEENTVFPIEICLSGHGEWANEMLFRSGSGNLLRGPVARTNGWGWTATTASHYTWMEMVNAHLMDDMAFGWARVSAVTKIEQYFDNFAAYQNRPLYLHIKTDVDAFGDPGIQYWKGVPQSVVADFSEYITPEARVFEVYVFDPEEEVDVPGAQVTIYAPGNMPAFDHNNYGEYDDMQMWTTTTDADGMARFVFDEGTELDGDELMVTVTGREILPYFGEAEIETPSVSIELQGYTLSDVGGNEDGDVNPGETFSLALTTANRGRQEAFGISAVLTTESPYIEIEDNEINFGDIEDRASADGDAPVTINVLPFCPDGESRPITRPVIEIHYTDGERQWKSAIRLNPVAPHLKVESIVGSSIIPTDRDNVELDLNIENVGGLNAFDITAEISSMELGVSIVENRAIYPDIRSGRSERIGNDGDPFIVNANRLVVPGSKSDMMIILSTENGFIDTSYFELQIGESREGAPQGPDGYGYICFDDTDGDWDIAPEYDWIEISRREQRRDFNGTEIDFDGDVQYDIGEAQVIDLGFSTQFYGRMYDQVTVSTNGFIAMGDQPLMVNYVNWPLDQAIGGGVGMVAPFWDHLKYQDNSDIYYFHNANEGYTIIEWYKLRHNNENGGDLTFQVILYDNQTWVTETGDQNILFQYKTINNVENLNDNDREQMGDRPYYDVGYASVGISSPEGTTGISYTFLGDYPVNAAELENQRAILFATSPKYRSGTIMGQVIDVADGSPMEGVVVFTEHGFTVVTDEDGNYVIEEALAEVPFDITARINGYNDSTYVDLMVEEDDTLIVNFGLLHPEKQFSQHRLYAQLEPDFASEIEFTLTNNGNGPLDWHYRKRLPGNADVNPWEHRESFMVSEETGDPRMRGVVWANNQFICSGGGRSARDDNVVYVLDRNGNLIESFQQFGNSRFGMGDMAWDGGLIWGGEDNQIFGFTAEGELQATFNTVFEDNQALAWDVDRNLLWITDMLSDNIIGYDRDGNEHHRLSQRNLNIYGLAYWPDDPDDYPLYIYHNIVIRDGDDLTLVHKMNPETGDTMFVADLGTEQDGKPEGAFITNQYDVYSWVYISVANRNALDKVDIWQLDARRDWFKVFDGEDFDSEIGSGIINAGESDNFVLSLNAFDLPRVPFDGQLIFRHNAVNNVDTLFVTLDVIGSVPPSPFTLLSPEDGTMINGNEQDQVTFVWEESNDPNWGDQIQYQLWIQPIGDTLLTPMFLAASDSSSLPLDLRDLNAAIENEPHGSFNWWIMAYSDPDTVLSMDTLSFLYVPNSVSADQDGVPVQFALESIYPSPFNGITTINFGADRAERITLRAYDISGREVGILYDNVSRVGHHQTVWNASSLPSGLYLIRLESAGRVKTAKIALIK